MFRVNSETLAMQRRRMVRASSETRDIARGREGECGVQCELVRRREHVHRSAKTGAKKKLLTRMDATLQSHQYAKGNDSSISLEKNLTVSTICESSEKAELLGSVTHCQESDGLITGQIRSSARVSKKMRLDSVCVSLSPVIDRKAFVADKLKDEERLDIPSIKEKPDIKEKVEPKERSEPKEKTDSKEKAEQKEKTEPKEKAEPKQTESKPKRLTQLWSIEEKNTFFEALNEYGKNFNALENYFATKASKKGMPESMAKTRLQIRHFYLRTWHKIFKYLKFPENTDMKKVTQELYGLINYGEMRKRIGFITEKICSKLNELVYRGTVHIRLRGKIVRIKTPMCRILRKINRLDENEEVVRLPTRVSIELRPKTNEAWQRVQSVAQNPRMRTKLPLQRRLSSLLSFLDHRWQHNCARHIEMLNTAIATADPSHRLESDRAEQKKAQQEPLLTIGPRRDANISVSAINLTEYLTSLNVCLNTYHDRFGMQSLEDPTFGKGSGKLSASKKATKKSRADGVCAADKKLPADAPHAAKQKEPAGPVVEPESFTANNCAVVVDSDNNACDSDPRLGAGSATDMAVNNILALNVVEPDVVNAVVPLDEQPKSETEEKPAKQLAAAAASRDSPQADEITARIRKGWNVKNSKTTTIGDLYLMFGANGNLNLDYWWEDVSTDGTKSLAGAELAKDAEKEKQEIPQEPTPNPLAGTLQKLISIANLETLKKAKVICPCGHVCGGAVNRNRVIQRIKPCLEAADRTGLEGSKVGLQGMIKPSPIQGRGIVAQVPLSDGVFRRPLLAPSQYKPGTAEAFKAQLEKFRPRFCNRRGRAVRQKNVVVQRQLPLLPKAPNGHAMVTLKVIPQTGEFLPISSPSLVASNPSNVIFPSGVTKVLPPPPTRSRHILPAVPVAAASVAPANITAPHPPVPASAAPQVVQGMEISRSFDANLMPSAATSSISNLLDLPLSSASLENESSLNTCATTANARHVTPPSFSTVFLPGQSVLETSTPPPSPSRIFKDETNSQWLTSEVADYSLSSLLGHLESPAKPSTLANSSGHAEDSRFSSDVEAQLQCLMSENSVDYTAKFADLAAQFAASSDASKK